jgi:hypothetical protein
MATAVVFLSLLFAMAARPVPAAPVGAVYFYKDDMPHCAEGYDPETNCTQKKKVPAKECCCACPPTPDKPPAEKKKPKRRSWVVTPGCPSTADKPPVEEEELNIYLWAARMTTHSDLSL